MSSPDNDGLFWDRFRRSYIVMAIAVTLVVVLFVVSCMREGAMSRSLDAINYDSLPAKAPRPTKPAEKLHASVTELKGLLSIQAKRDLSGKQADQARAARAGISAELQAVHKQFGDDRAKLGKLGAKAALARLDKIETSTSRLEHPLQTALAQVPADGERAADASAEATRLLKELSPPAAHQSLSSGIGFGTEDASRRPASLNTGITPAYGSPTPTDVASELPRTPEPADLAETPETKVTPAIHALAQQLNRDPVKIYGYVHNNIRYEPYYGIRKGADQTLAEKSGSDADQAALTIALLRDSGVNARFVQGVAELPAAKAANWLGVDVAAGERIDSAPGILASGGIPTTQIRANGELVKVRFDHLWVEAYVPANAYRGVDEQIGGKAWLPLDPSIRTNDFRPGVENLASVIAPAVDAWGQRFMDDAQKVGPDGLIAPSASQSAGSAQTLIEDVGSRLEDHGVTDDSTLGDVIGNTDIRPVASEYLPNTTPFYERSVLSELRAIPAPLNSTVTVAVAGNDPLSQPSSDPDEGDTTGFTYTARTSDLANRRVTLAYVPATEEDAAIIDAYHGLLNAPTYVAALIPVLRVNGQVVARGHQPVSTGYTQQFKITYRMPGYAADVVENPVYVGSLSALAIAVGPGSADQLKARATQLSNMPDFTAENVLTDARAGEYFSILGSYYFIRNDVQNALSARVGGISQTRLLSGGIVSNATAVSYLAGFPVYSRFAGLSMDVDQDVQAVVSKTGDERTRKLYLSNSGMWASSSESAAFTNTLGVASASTAQVLRTAAVNGTPVFKIDASNIDRVDQLLELPDDVIGEIVQAVRSRGATVIVPKTEVTIGGWRGTGYVLEEGDTSSYRISGGLNGAIIAMTQGLFEATLGSSTFQCVFALNDYSDALTLAASALLGRFIGSVSVIVLGDVLVGVAAIWFPIFLFFAATIAIYILAQAVQEGSDCAEGAGP